MVAQLRDIENSQDIEVVLRDFYPKAFEDPIIGFMFTDVAKADLEGHIASIVQFWSKVLFREGDYDTNVLKKHTDLDALVRLKPGHFTRWLFLFEKALDSNFSGETVEVMRKRAYMVADSINAAIGRNNGVVQKKVPTLDR